jgi:ABC-2 type transport system ATP-binding protein
MTLVETRELTKRYGAVAAVDALTWSVPAGCIVGLLGANGAGKTTTLEMLLGLVHPTSGDAWVLGHDVRAEPLRVAERVAFVPEEVRLYPAMRVERFLRFYGAHFPGFDAEGARSLLARWRVSLDRKSGALSKGQRAKVLLAAALARRPQLLVLDEPTSGLDPAAIEDLLTILVQWAADGRRSAILSTHRIDEVERISDRVAVIDDGRLRASGVLDDLRESWKVVTVESGVGAATLRAWPEVVRVAAEGSALTVVTSDGEMLIDRLRAREAMVLAVRDMNLREIYLALTGYDEVTSDALVESLV